MSNELEQLEFKLEKNIGIEKHAGKVRKSMYVCIKKFRINLNRTNGADKYV